MASISQHDLDLDGLCKQAFGLSKTLLLKLLAGLFDDHYDPGLASVNFGIQQLVDQKIKHWYPDHVFIVHQDNITRHYHIEVQTTNDSSMVIRMFRYGFEMTFQEAKMSGDFPKRHRLEFPKQIVIFLEENREIKDNLEIELVLPSNQVVPYSVPTFKLWEHDISDLYVRELILLLPFKVFDFRKKIRSLAASSKPKKDDLIADEFDRMLDNIKQVSDILINLQKSNRITIEELNQMIAVLENIVKYLYDKLSSYRNKSIVEEVHAMLTHFIEPALLAKERLKGEIKIARNMLIEGLSPELVIRVTGLSEEEVLKLQAEIAGKI